MAKLKIFKGKEFKAYVTDIIEADNLFFDEYRRAAGMLDEIVRYDEKNNVCFETENENNIIAFCGERGDGKSSAMMTFAKAVKTYSSNCNRNQEVFDIYTAIENTFFTSPVMIDPSLFDAMHSILDVILARLYKEVDSIYKNSQNIKECDYEEIISQFQRVYKYVLLINNQKRSYDEVYEYEGDIGRLANLGDSTNLKKELIELIDKYLKFSVFDTVKNKRRLVIAIDDLDLCSDKAYRMAEEIRKYLIIPNVVIIMALRIEQLEDCIREKNLKDYEESVKRPRDNDQFTGEINMMAEKYVNKLIPKARRIYLPKVGSFQNLGIEYIDDWGARETVIWRTDERQNVVAAIRGLIYEKTGILLLPREMGKNLIFSDNLRELVDLVAFLQKMPDTDVGEPQRYRNVVELEEYLEREWEHNAVLQQDREAFDALRCSEMDSVNDNAVMLGEKIFYEKPRRKDPVPADYFTEINNSFTWVINCIKASDSYLSNVYQKARAYHISVFYTFMLHKMLLEERTADLMRLLGGYVWCGAFSGIIPSVGATGIDRARFTIRTQDAYNKILHYINSGAEEVAFTYVNEGTWRVSGVPDGDKRKDYIHAWILTALLANNFGYNNYQLTYLTNGTIVWNNSNTHEFVHISLENYIVALFNIDSIFEKVSFAALGISGEIKEYIDRIKACNRASIQFMREVVANIDIVTSILDYCRANGDDKSGSEDETNRTEKLVKKFLENMAAYMGQYGVKANASDLTSFALSEDQRIDVCRLYALLVDIARGYKENAIKTEREGERLMSAFREKLRVTPLPESWEIQSTKASGYLKVATAANAKGNLECLATNIQRYIGENKRAPYELNSDALCDLYAKVIKLYLVDEKALLSEELKNEYKRLAKIQIKL